MLKNIFVIILIFKSININAQEVKFSYGRILNFEAARLTLMPRYMPLLYMPILKMQVSDATRKSIPFYNNVDGLIGVDLHYYAPNSRITFGSYVDVLRQQLTILDVNHPTFTNTELHLKPYIHLKTGDFTEWLHWDMNVGGSFIGAFQRSAIYEKNGQLHTQARLNTVNSWKIELFGGIGFTLDLTELDKNALFESFFANRIRLFTAGIQWHLPIPNVSASNFFAKSRAYDNSILDDYRTYNANGSYLTFTFGTKIDLFDYYYRNNWNNPVLQTPKVAALLPPHYFKEPIRNQFGGFHVDMSFQPTLDSVSYQTKSGLERYPFRNSLNYCIGYNYHFLGNYDIYENKEQSKIQRNLFGGIQITNRNFTPENNLLERYHTTALGGDIGGRIGWNGYYAFGGGILDYHFINEKWVGENQIVGESLFKRIEYSLFGGFSYRNALSVKLQYKLQAINQLNQLEFWISAGF